MKFKSFYKQSRENVELALMSLWVPGTHRMRAAVKDLFRREPLTAEPVFQSIFPWRPTTDPNWRTYLDKDVVKIQEDKARARGDVFTPFQHQTESWKALSQGDSIVVTSGTGSGKTECFMLPVLSDLHSRAATPVADTPVEAIFLYPLNALMQDQRDRLGSDCEKLGLRFAVYNSSLEERKSPPSKYAGTEVMTRAAMRLPDKNGAPSCPQILLTNPSMLEYMLVREKDQPIFQRSQGKLRWIIIDEAHTYLGSAGIELEYLIKRVLSAFGVTRDQVRIVCTSATIGDKSNPKELTDFIETLVGKYTPSCSKKLVAIDGDRVIPAITPQAVQGALNSAGLSQLSVSNVTDLMSQVNDSPMALSAMMDTLGYKALNIEDALGMVDALCDLTLGKDFLFMLRGHFFMRNVGGIYACVNDHCSCHGDYAPTGFHYLTTVRGNGKCPHCGAPLFELVQCGDCKEFILECEENDNHEIRASYSDLSDADESFEEDDDDSADGATAGGTQTDNWTLTYLAWYGQGRKYAKPHPDYTATRLELGWDDAMMRSKRNGQAGPWVMLENDGSNYCPTCAKGSGEDGSRFSRFRLSTNWLNEALAPAIMMEGKNATNEWGKYIAFTDSRQGTAINAKRFNVESERAFARTRLAVELSKPYIDPTIVAAAKVMQQQMGMTFDQCLKALNVKPGGFGQYSIKDVANIIFNKEIFEHIDFEISKPGQKRPNDEDSYKTSLVRSIVGRRPVHLQNIENLGLAKLVYPAIDACKSLPATWSRMGFSLDEWKDFLKISIDYVIRMGNHLQCPSDNETQYLRDADRSTPFDPDAWAQVTVNTNGAPSVKQSRLVLLLCQALGILDTSALASRIGDINSLLNEVWTFLSTKVLTEVVSSDKYHEEVDDAGNHVYDGWYYLDMSLDSTACKLTAMEKGWICPVTSYVLDTIFRGCSPSVKGCLCPENLGRFMITSAPVSLPVLGSKDFASDLTALNASGLYNDRHKYAFIGSSGAYLTAEHSGQQNRELLDHYTDEFKKDPHQLNLLQCSTTMEMGVDIGDIDIVMMTNIPPTTANYMQRAGRAGRRGQNRAISFALCPDNPIGVQAFKDPMGILTGINSARMPVESSIVVQRHVNSFLIRSFLCDPANAGIKFSKIHPWLESGGVYQSFGTWLALHAGDPALTAAYQDIFGTGVAFQQACTVCRNTLDAIALDYQTVITNLNNALTAATSKAKQDALAIQCEAVMNQEPKGFLAEQQFLPNADMPTGVVEFYHPDAYVNAILERKKADLQNLRNKLSQPGLNATQLYNLNWEIQKCEEEIRSIYESVTSSREIKVALSEYAPGQMVVINERNYISAGIEWNNSLGQKQPLKYLYYCPSCGRYEYSTDSTLVQCPNCNGILEGVLASDKKTRHCTYAIEPIRFRTDVNKGRNRKEKTEKYFYEIKTILTEVDWGKKTTGPMCDLVGSSDSKGEIVFYNAGIGEGFTLCYDCGRMEVWKRKRDATNWPHKDITEKDVQCPASNPANHVLLGGRFPTTFVSLRFYKDPSGNTFEKDEDLLNSLGVLLCRALAKVLGINRDDIDFDVRQECDPAQNNQYSSIFIYDTQKGGCGYSTRMLDNSICKKVFTEAWNMLQGFGCHCESSIKGACVNCLVDRFSKRYMGNLSKYKAMRWFLGQKMFIGNHSQGAAAVPTPPRHLVTQLYSKGSVNSITFCVDGSSMELSKWISMNGSMGVLLNECYLRGKKVKILVANVPDASKGASFDSIVPFVDLNQKFKNWNIDVETVPSLEASPGKYSVLIVNGKDHYFTDQKDVLPFTDDWGINCTRLFEDQSVPVFTKGQFPTVSDIPSLIQPDEVLRTWTVPAGNRTRIDRLFSLLKPDLLKGNDESIIKGIIAGKKVSIEFSDTYVNSALASLMLVYLIKELRDEYKFSIKDVSLKVQSRPEKRNCYNPRYSPSSFITFNFPDENDADAYTKKCFEDVLGITPVFSTMVPDHYRWIRIQPEGENCYIELRPDHGISGGWQSSDRYCDLDYLDGSAMADIKPGDSALYYLLLKK